MGCADTQNMKQILFATIVLLGFQLSALAQQKKAIPESAESLKISEEIVGALVHKANGDMEKLQKMLVEIQKNPQYLESLLTEEQKKRVRELSSQKPPASFEAEKK